RPPARVLEELTGVLVDRDALSADLAPELRTSLVEVVRTGQEAQFSSESVTLGARQLAEFVPE
ncbi:MAG: hypothetical protein GWN99_15410, partial [Gemmatimonadetes bacterium]|nr:hypothetical protein [Gemmatimonadota bacterium]NIS02433.1 hypothetical protein [Gemmatimonadota bacterium]NIU51670.1 hypothetical protein [Gemmatimonadota bacterium]NIV24905.1 hypothetical protein [Gemmatimonadota bacterium]NIW38894.1 hypothetical protein [Gemmatimonadota bacterium]